MSAPSIDSPGELVRQSSTKSDFSARLAPYRKASWARAVAQLSLTVGLFIACWAGAYAALPYSYALTVALAVPAGGLLVRLFCLMHDCTHGSFFPSRRANDVVGFVLGVVTWTPYAAWRRLHACHHATSGNLDRRGEGGDIRMLTVREYLALSRWSRWYYRFYRHPLVLFGIGPVWHFCVSQRFTYDLPASWKAERRSVYWTNLALVGMIAGVCYLFGWRETLWVQAPVTLVSSAVGVWLFFVQHNYDDAYWRDSPDWSFVDAALHGSSHYRLPRPLEWLTARIGLHHIHHLDSKIPNYRLRRCLEENREFQEAPVLTLRASLRCARHKLWDEASGRMVGFDVARRLEAASKL